MSRLPAASLMSVGLLAAAVLAAPQADPRPEQSDAIDRVGEYVRQYLAAARTIVAREKLTLQPLDRNLRPDGSVRRLEYETQVEWEPAADDSGGGLARVHRELISVDGRARRPGDDAGCLAAESAEPLEFLLPARRSEFTFSPPVPTTIDRRPALRIDYAPVMAGIPSLEWVGDCGHLVMPGQARGQVTVDPATFAVLRLDQTLVSDVLIPLTPEQRRPGWGDSLIVERSDVTIDFTPVRFRDPDETILLPSEIRRISVVLTPAARRLAVTQQWSNHRRFVTAGRVVPVR